MSQANQTSFEKRCEILADFWLTYDDDETFQEFIKYNDLGLPLAYAYSNEIISYPASDKAKALIDEAWRLLLSGLSREDTGFEDLSDLLNLE
jgi:hypothetical protein